METLILAATRIFVKEGYGLASIDKIATEAGISTRTIYERFKNKGDLMAAVILRLIDHDMSRLSVDSEFERMEPLEALTLFGRTVTERITDPESAALFRILATEAQRFPELTAKVLDVGKIRFESALAGYFARQTARGVMSVADPERAAALFMHMITAEMHECQLFKSEDAIRAIDQSAHVARVVQIFLHGTLVRAGRSE